MSVAKVVWYLKQLLPLTYWTTYREGGVDGPRRLAIWRMWLGRCFDVLDVPVVEAEDIHEAV